RGLRKTSGDSQLERAPDREPIRTRARLLLEREEAWMWAHCVTAEPLCFYLVTTGARFGL
ncbi:Uncharacterized protein DAT39_004691, partial [Clarias magur]